MNKFARMMIERGEEHAERDRTGDMPYYHGGGYDMGYDERGDGRRGRRRDRAGREDYRGDGRRGRRRDRAGYDMRGGRSGMRIRNDYGEYDMPYMRRGDHTGMRGDMRHDMGYGREYGYSSSSRMPYYADSADSDMRGDYARRGDYAGEPEEYFTMEDLKKWKKHMMNADGTKGEHFSEEECKKAAEKAGIEMKHFDEDIFCTAMNMVYSDYCEVAKEHGIDKPEFYAELAEAFLCDEDFDGTPEEKLYIYYKCIAEQD